MSTKITLDATRRLARLRRLARVQGISIRSGPAYPRRYHLYGGPRGAVGYQLVLTETGLIAGGHDFGLTLDTLEIHFGVSEKQAGDIEMLPGCGPVSNMTFGQIRSLTPLVAAEAAEAERQSQHLKRLLQSMLGHQSA